LRYSFEDQEKGYDFEAEINDRVGVSFETVLRVARGSFVRGHMS